MGCTTSKLDDEEAVQLCRDRRNFIKQAVEQRYRFALGHISYIDSLRRVSLALLNFVEGNEHHDFIADHCTTPPFTPVKRLSPENIGIPLKTTTHVANYLRSGGNPSIPVEEWPRSPETMRVKSFYPSNYYGIDGFFTYEASQMNRPFTSSPYSRLGYPPPSPQNSQWDFFWNPFSSLDQYDHRYSCNDDDDDDEKMRLRKVREEEGIPALEEIGVVEEEEDEEEEDGDDKEENKEDENSKPVTRPTSVLVFDEKKSVESDREKENVHELKECQTQGVESMEVSETRDAVEDEATARNSAAEETPGFTVYVNRRPTSMIEVIKDVNSQFVRVFDSVREVSVMLEARRAQYSASNELTGVKMLNPAALFRSSSSRSSSSRFLETSINLRDEGDETSSNYSEECGMISESQQLTLGRLYAWEKKLHEEVKCGESIRIAYEKKCMQLRKHDANGEEPAVVDRTRAAIRDLHTRLKVAMHSIESVSRRIETLRDEELYPQLMELIQALARMWRAMADCHRIQRRTIDEAKLLLFSSSSTTTVNMPRISEASFLKSSTYAANLVSELRNWRSCLAAWIPAQRSYARALSGWISRCARPQINPDDDQTGSGCAPPVFGLCVQWSRLLDSVSEARVIEGIDFFAAGVWSVSMQQREGALEGAIMAAAEGMPEVGERVLCAGMSAAVGSLTEFAASSAEGHDALVKKFKEGGRAGRAES